VVWQGSAGNRCPYADQTPFSSFSLKLRLASGVEFRNGLGTPFDKSMTIQFWCCDSLSISFVVICDAVQTR
jgi:hypothetical protein